MKRTMLNGRKKGEFIGMGQSSTLRRPENCRLCFIPLLILPTHIIIITGDHSLIGQGGVELLNLIGDQRPNVSLSTPPSLMVVF